MGIFRATRYVASLPLVDVQVLVDEGVRLVLLDRDNTCVPRDAQAAPAEVVAWLDAARAAGLSLCLVSNNFHSSQVGRTAQHGAQGGYFLHAAASFFRLLNISTLNTSTARRCCQPQDLGYFLNEI